jgi:hypothetical protein
MKRKFKFVGQPGEKIYPEDINHVAFGLDFSGGVEVEVKDKRIINKLSNNSHYEDVTPKKGKTSQAEDEQDN